MRGRVDEWTSGRVDEWVIEWVEGGKRESGSGNEVSTEREDRIATNTILQKAKLIRWARRVK